MDENIFLYSADNREFSAKLLREAYAIVKSNLQNVLHNTQFCAICLNSQKDSFYQLDFAGSDIDSECSVEAMMMDLFNEKVLHLSSEYICELCQNNLKQAYTFIALVKNCSLILDNYIEQINYHVTNEVISKTEFTSTIILLQDEVIENSVMNEKQEIDTKSFITDTNTFMCDVCSETFHTKTAIAHHITEAHTRHFQKTMPTVKSCPECDVFPCIHERYLLYWKQQTVTGSRLFRCLDCNYASTNKTYLISHINKNHLNLSSHLCESCGKSFPSRLAHRSHVKRFHQDSLSCSHCGKVFRILSNLNRHEDNCKTLDRPYTCDTCPASFVTENQLELHTKRHTLNYHCKLCPKAFMHEVTLKRHNRRAHENKRLIKYKSKRDCSICDAKFDTLFELKKHLNTQHNSNEKHRCNICNKSFDTRRIYKAHCRSWPHLRRADPNTTFTFKCDHCEYSCASAKNLENHKNLFHLKIKPYVCPQCGKAFTTATHLKHHMERHEGIKRYQCTDCSLCLTTLSSLKKHILRHHAAEKPYSCEACDKTFVNISERDLHISRMHSEKSLSCPICECKFHTRLTVRAHVRKVHAKNRKIGDYLKDNEHNAKLMEIFRDHRIPFVES